MAFRRTHYRRGFYRRTPSGGITWVNPTTVSGYSYEPGTIYQDESISNFKYAENVKPQPGFFENQYSNIIREICKQFSLLSSESRKHCLDILKAYDEQLDQLLANSNAEEKINESPEEYSTDFYRYTVLDDQTIRINRYRKSRINELIVPESIEGRKVTQINSEAFKYKGDLQSVILPSTISYIGDRAFEGCIRLKNIYLSESVTYIGKHAFMNTAIEEVNIPNVEYLGESCFASCENLHRVLLSDKLSMISPFLFLNCVSLKTIDIPRNVRSIGAGAFRNTSLEGPIYIPDSCKEIDISAFIRKESWRCKMLELYIPESVKTFNLSSHYSWEIDVRNLADNFIMYCERGSQALRFAQAHRIPNRLFNRD